MQHASEIRNTSRILTRKSEETDYFRDLGVDGRMILKGILH
jgi:hypothetical protein